jgi:DNA-binding transcriptional LysR family regulator
MAATTSIFKPLSAVARERSFTRVAAKLGLCQSMLSHTVQSLRHGSHFRLLTRGREPASPVEAATTLSLGLRTRATQASDRD